MMSVASVACFSNDHHTESRFERSAGGEWYAHGRHRDLGAGDAAQGRGHASRGHAAHADAATVLETRKPLDGVGGKPKTCRAPSALQCHPHFMMRLDE